MKAINKETEVEYQYMVNTSEFVYGSLGVDNQIAEVVDYLINDDEDKLVEVVTEAEFAEKYSVK